MSSCETVIIMFSSHSINVYFTENSRNEKCISCFVLFLFSPFSKCSFAVECWTGIRCNEKYEQRSDAVRMGVTVGFYTRSGINIAGNKERFNALPIIASGEFVFLKNNFRPFIGFGAGLMGSMFTNLFGFQFNLQPVVTPQVGLDYHLNEKFGVNVNFKYHIIFYRDESTSGPDFFSMMSPNVGVYYRFE